MKLKAFIKGLLGKGEKITLWKYNSNGKRVKIWNGVAFCLPKSLLKEKVQKILSFSCLEINTRHERACTLNIVLKGEIKVKCDTCAKKENKECLLYGECHHLRLRPMWEYKNAL